MIFEALKKDVKIMAFLPVFALASIYGFGVMIFGLSFALPLDQRLEYFIFLIFGFTKEIMPLHKYLGLYDNYIFLGQWPTAIGMILDISGIMLFVLVLNLFFLRVLRICKKG